MRNLISSFKRFLPEGNIKEYLRKLNLRYEIYSNKGIRIPFYDYGKENFLFIDDIIKEINKVLNLRNDKEIELYTKKFEEEFAKFCGCKYAVGLSSGTTALIYSLVAAGLKPDEEVIIPPNTYIATAMAVQDMGAKPVFVDINANTHNIDIEKITNKITEKTKVIIPVHLYGHMVDMDRINLLAKKYNLIVIEDACQAHGSEFKGRCAGSFGLTGCFSLHISKMMGCLGEGGIAVTNDVKTYNIIKDMCEPYYGPVSLKGKRTPARLSYLQSAICRAKLRKIDESIEKKNNLAQIYSEKLSGVKGVKLPPKTPHFRDNFRNFTLRVKEQERLMGYLLKNGVESRIFYETPIHLSDTFSYLGYKRGDFPLSEEFAKETLSLPIGLHLSKEDVQYVAEKIASFYSY